MVKEDNVEVIHLANNSTTYLNSEHIDVRQHFLRKCVANGKFKVVCVPSEQQHANFLTVSKQGGVLCLPRLCGEYSLVSLWWE